MNHPNNRGNKQKRKTFHWAGEISSKGGVFHHLHRAFMTMSTNMMTRATLSPARAHKGQLQISHEAKFNPGCLLLRLLMGAGRPPSTKSAKIST